MKRSKFVPLLVAVAALLLLANSAMAQPVVEAVRAIGTNPNIPHSSVGDGSTPTSFMAVVTGGAAPYTYQWDFQGDGTFDTAVLNSSNGDLPATFVYPALANTRQFTAIVRVTDNNSDTDTTTMVVRVHTTAEFNIERQTNKAIDDGLWFLHRNLTRSSVGGVPVAYFNETNGSYDSRSEAATAAAILAFQNQGHRIGVDAANPYRADVVQLHNYLLSKLVQVATPVQPGGNPDVNGNGFGLHVNTGGTHMFYANALALMALSTSSSNDRLVPAGLPNAGQPITFIVQEMVDYFSYAQGDSGTAVGSFAYFANGSRPDGSQNHFVSTALLWARATGEATIPQFVIDNYRVAISNTQNANGGFGYSNSNQWVNLAKTGGNLNTFALVGEGPNEPLVLRARQFIADNWGSVASQYANIGDFYAMWSVMKGARSYDPPIVNFVGSGGNSIDWYDSYRQYLVSTQLSDGSFPGNASHWPLYNRHPFLKTAFGIEILQTVLLETPPVAVADADSFDVAANSTVNLYHHESYHLGIGRTLVSFEWDFDNDGTYDYTTNDLTEVVPMQVGGVGTYTVRLRVVDDIGETDTDELTIEATIQNHAPIAVGVPAGQGALGSDYIAVLGQPLQLDGSESFDPDTGDGDMIIDYGWDLNGDDDFSDLAGATPLLSLPAGWVAGGTYTIALRVTDDGSWDGRADTNNLTGVASVTIHVVEDDAPIADPQSVDTLEETPVTIQLSGSSLYSNTLTANIVTLPGLGTLHQFTAGGIPGAAIAPGDQVSDPDLQVVFVPAENGTGIPYTTFRFTVADGHGVSAPATVTINVFGTPDPPVADAGPDATVELVANCEDIATLDGSGSFDVDGDLVTYEWTGIFGAINGEIVNVNLPMGEHEILLTVTDATGLQDTDTVIITVVDTTPPVMSAPADVEAECEGPDGTAVALETPFAEDNCGEVTVTSDAPALFPHGTMVVTWTATDDSGNSTQVTQLVTIVDTTPPTIVPPADVTVECAGGAGTPADLGMPMVSDICDPVLDVSHDAPALFPHGTTTVTWTATDNSGNQSTATQLVTVVDTTPPALTAPADMTVECAGAAGTPVADLVTPIVSDLCDGAPNVSNDAPALFPHGDTTVTWTAVDASGNTSTATQVVSVVDTTPPTIEAPADVSAECAGHDGTPVEIGMATATDLCSPDNVTITHDAPAVFHPGTTTVTWTATDASGNAATATQIVTIVDTTPPVVQSMTASPDTLWAPNHKMVAVTVSGVVTDVCDATPTCRIVSVTSDEPLNSTGDGNTDVDYVITGDMTVELRAERKGNGDGRVYTITIECSDDAGNVTTTTVTVTVAHDQGNGGGNANGGNGGGKNR